MNKLYISKKYYEYINNIRKIHSSHNLYYELLIPKDLCEDIIRESNPSECIKCRINYNNYYRIICIYYKYLLDSKLNNVIINKIKKKIRKIDNVLEETFNMGNTMIYYDHICSSCINDTNKHKIIN